MRNELMYDLMLEVEGILRSRALRIRRERELEPGDVLDLDGRRWKVTQVGPIAILARRSPRRRPRDSQSSRLDGLTRTR